ncbi:TPA: hypothetical protein NIA41_000491 [Pseudomonas aeruginosa]|nr:hypothetical protein [Pseudomonas aeruginosa]
MISTVDFSKRFIGYNISDCEIRNKEFFYFIAREDCTQWTDWEEDGGYPEESSLYKRVVTFIRTDPVGSQWGHVRLRGFERLTAGISILPKEQFVAGSLTGQIYVLGSGDDEIQDSIKSQLPGTLSKFNTIQGELYLVGSGRCAAIRKEKNKWVWLNKDIPYDPATERSTAGFRAIDGFSSNDIYAAGGDGDVWHFNGNSWRRVDFPSNLFLETVCCGSDGRVYISGYEGHTFVGRGDTWKKVKSKELISLAFKDMVWYEDRVWCTNDYGVWWIVNDQLVKADIPAFAQISAGHLSARDGVLLLAGFYGAAFLENGQWHKIFSYSEMVDRCKAEGLYDGVLQARWHEFKV